MLGTPVSDENWPGHILYQEVTQTEHSSGSRHLQGKECLTTKKVCLGDTVLALGLLVFIYKEVRISHLEVPSKHKATIRSAHTSSCFKRELGGGVTGYLGERVLEPSLVRRGTPLVRV